MPPKKLPQNDIIELLSSLMGSSSLKTSGMALSNVAIVVILFLIWNKGNEILVNINRIPEMEQRQIKMLEDGKMFHERLEKIERALQARGFIMALPNTDITSEPPPFE